MREPPPLPDAPFELAGPVDAARPFTVAGRRALVTGWESRGISEAWIHPVRVLTNLRVLGARANAVRVTALGLQRELEVGSGRLHERILVPRELPTVLVEWTLPPPAGGALELQLAWMAFPAPTGGGPSREPRPEPDGLVFGSAALQGSARAAVAFVLDAASDWDLREGSESGSTAIVATVRLRPGESIRFAASLGESAELALGQARTGVRTFRDQLRARLARVRRQHDGHLGLQGPGLASRTLAWAGYRLDSYLVHTPRLSRCFVSGYSPPPRDVSDPAGDAATSRVAAVGGPPPNGLAAARETPGTAPACRAVDAVWTGLAALATGDFPAARDALRFLSAFQDRTGRIPDAVGLDGATDFATRVPHCFHALLASRYLAWTADVAALQSEWPHLLRSYRWLAADGGMVDALTRAAVGELGIIAETLGERSLLAELRGRASFDAAQAADAAWLETLPIEITAGWSRYLRGDPEAGMREWREAAARGFTVARGAWPNLLCPDHASTTALVVLSLVHGVWGIRPDAPAGRLHFAPVLPADWREFELRNLRLGDAHIGVSYQREGALHTFRLAQETGPVPVTVLLEPALPGQALASAWVDGTPATLDARPRSERLVTPVQVVLDHEREIRLQIVEGQG